MDTMCNTPICLVLLILAGLLAPLMEGKTISNMTTEELHQLLRFLQPFAAEPVRLFPEMQRHSSVNQQSQLKTEPQVKSSYYTKPYATYDNAYGSWQLEKQYLPSDASLYGVCPKCEPCPPVPPCPANPTCPPNPKCPENPTCPDCPTSPDCPAIPPCPISPKCPSLVCPEPPTCPTLSCPQVYDCPDVPPVPTIPDCPTAPSCPPIPDCLTPLSSLGRVTVCGTNSNSVISSAHSGTIDVPFAAGATQCVIGLSPPAPYTRVQLTCSSIPTGTQVASPNIPPTNLVTSTQIDRSLFVTIATSTSPASGSRLTCSWTSAL